MDRLFPVILAGGRGARLWPLSRANLPKPFLPLLSERTLLQETAARVAKLGAAAPIVLCSIEHRHLAASQLKDIGAPPQVILTEPSSRGTAAAAITAALFVAQTDPQALVLLLPSDHEIGDVDAFLRSLDSAAEAAKADKIVLFGIKPTSPEMGYGYIHKGVALGVNAFTVGQFIEKPSADTARKFMNEGWLWNSGMFLFRAESFLEEAKHLAPEIYSAASTALAAAKYDREFVLIDAAAYARASTISLDHAIIEKTSRAAVVSASFHWSDVGSWPAVHAADSVERNGNAITGNAMAMDTQNTYLRSDGPLAAAIGVRDLTIVATKDAVLIAGPGSTSQIKALSDKLEAEGRAEALAHLRVERPWGSYETIDKGEGFQVKRIVVKPGAALSLQMHHKRAEHWVVVAGTARVTRNDEVFILKQGESTAIPLGTRHRLENPGDIDLYLIEVQMGSYLGEDDIVRFADVYGRA